MKVVFHEKYYEVYSSDPASEPGRMESIVKVLGKRFEMVEPEPASEHEVALVHTHEHIENIRDTGLAHEIALLAVGGAIRASEYAMEGEAAFALIRPPGHHASPDSCWGFCFYNSIAIAVERLRNAGRVGRALIMDIDLHFGDGTANAFSGVPEVTYLHPEGGERNAWMKEFMESLAKADRQYDILALSAGFDRHEEDWGGTLSTEDYGVIGRALKEYSEKRCRGRRFGVLEGGYNHSVLGRNVEALLDGFS